MNDKLVLDNQNFVLSIARQYVRPGIEFDDLVSEGMIGLIKAANLFDETKGQMFHQYAVWHIRKSIETYLSKEQPVVYKRTISDSLASTETSSDASLLSNPERREELQQLVNKLPERERTVLTLYFGLNSAPQNMTEIAHTLGLTRYRVKALRKRALRHLQHPLT